ncbi:MAG: TSUP family transporter, partial [Xanthobacteraceae bacterium]
VEFFLPARLEPWFSPLIGTATGIVTAATGVYMIPSVPYLQAIGLEKDDLVRALGLSFTVSTLALAATLMQDGALQMPIAGVSLLALAPALVGMVLGQWVRARVRSETFRICLFAGSLLLGAHLVLRPLI